MPTPDFDNRKYWEDRFADELSLKTVGEINLRASYIRWLYRLRRSIFRKRITPLARGNSWAVADIGCGTGFYVDLWHEAGVRSLIGVDITDKAVSTLAAKYSNDRFIRADISRDTLPDITHLDAVSAFDVLFHVVEDAGFEHAIRSIATMLRPGGYFFITDVFQREQKFDEGHQVGRSLESMTTTIRAAGFEIVERRAMFFLMSDPTDSRSRLHKRLYFTVHHAAARSEGLAWLVGLALYPLDWAATRVLHEGPSIELLVARRL